MSARVSLFAMMGCVLACGVARAAEAPLSDADRQQLEALGREFPSGTSLRVTPHFLIVYDVPDAFVSSRVRLLEMVRTAFFNQFTRDGFDPKPPANRLVCILFKNYTDYIAYSQRTGAVGVSGTGGYYAANTNRIAIFDNRSNPNLAEIGVDMELLSRTIAELDNTIEQAGRDGDAQRVATLRNQRGDVAQKLIELHRRHSTSAGLSDIAQTFHEATHQFAFNSGVQRRGVVYPLWLSEGLATSFETINPAVQFGPGERNPNRQQRLTAIGKRRAFAPLRELIALTELNDATMDRKLDVYAESWSLFQYLYTKRLAALRTYLQQQGERNGPVDVATMLRDFEAAFGPVAEVENGWRDYVAALKP